MSLNPETNYAVIADGKLINIILCNPTDLPPLEDIGASQLVELTDENYFNIYNRPKIDDWFDGEDFIPGSWSKNADGTFTPPVPMPTDGLTYEWNVHLNEWSAVTPFPSWIWDPVTRVATPPFASPEGEWKWNEEDQSWEPLPPMPTDGQAYVWNPITSSWQVVV